MARQALGAASLPFQVAVGTGVGGAVAGAIAPAVRSLENDAWNLHSDMPMQAIEAAQLVADGEREMGWGKGEAANVGVNGDRFEALVNMIDTAPDLGILYEGFRRGLLGEAAFRRGAKRHSIEDEWLDLLVDLAARILSPAEAAAAWQQGYMSEGEASAEAQRSGVSAERALIQRELAGLPPGPETGLAMLRRGIIDEGAFEQMIVEGNTKRKYADEYLALRQNINSATTAASLWLKGWLSEGEAKAIGAQNGYDAAAMDRLYQDRGRPATVRQAHIGFARGGRLPSAGNNEQETIRRSVEESNIRSEWFDILYAQRFTYPSAFVLRALATDGTFSEAETRQILIESGWKPEWADAASSKWSGGGAGPTTKWADRARSQLFSAAHADYLDGNASEGDARAMLGRVGATGAEQDTIIGIWEMERNRTRRDLTQAQVLKLYKKAIWTREQAQAALDDLGMEPADAAALLDAV